ncbi:MAG TPA: hypothetical protein VF310_00380 [Vicinamibacteria bacterium]
MSALLLLLLAGPAVSATPSKAEVAFGEVFTLEVKATGEPGTDFTFPAEVVEEGYELRTAAAPAGASPAPDPGVHRYAAAAFAVGEVEIGPIAVRYRRPDGQVGELHTPALKVKVSSLLPKDPQQQTLADIRAPLRLGVGRAFWIALALAALALAALAWALWRRRRRQAEPEAALPALSPEDEARQALEALARRGIDPGALRGFYIALTEIAKRYLERRLGAPVLEMTSAETLAFLRDHPAAGPLLGPMRDLTAAADAVKFARGQALVPEAERHLGAVRALVEALEQRLRPPEPAPAEPGGRAA